VAEDLVAVSAEDLVVVLDLADNTDKQLICCLLLYLKTPKTVFLFLTLSVFTDLEIIK
jgi:hypothetical protein